YFRWAVGHAKGANCRMPASVGLDRSGRATRRSFRFYRGIGLPRRCRRGLRLWWRSLVNLLLDELGHFLVILNAERDYAINVAGEDGFQYLLMMRIEVELEFRERHIDLPVSCILRI